MNGLSEDDSSDSSSEYLVNPEEINLNSSFFAKKKRKARNIIKSDIDESSDDKIDFNQMDNIEQFTDILKKLESSQKFEITVENVENKQIFTHDITPQKEKKTPQSKKEVKETTISNEIAELLLQGESSVSPLSKDKLIGTTVKDEENEEANNEYSIPKEDVQIILPGTNMVSNEKKKRSEDLKKQEERKININIEKADLLGWLYYGFDLNQKINEPEVMAASLSLISTNKYPNGRIDLSYLEKFTKFFKNIFTFEAIQNNGNKRINKETLLKAIEEKKVSDYRELVLLYIAALRALGLQCRLVISLCPQKGELGTSKTKSNAAESKATSKLSKKKADKSTMILNTPEAKKNANAEAKKRAAEVLRSKSQMDGKKIKLDTKAKSSSVKSNDNEKKSEDVKEEKNISNLRQLRSRKVGINSKDNKTEKSTDETSKSDGTKSKYYKNDDSTDSEEEFHPKLKHVTKKILNRTDKVAQSFKISMKNNKKLLSSDKEIEEILHSKSQMNGKRIKLDTKAAKSSSTKSNDDEKKSEDVKEEKNISTLKQLRSRKVGINSKDNKTEKSTEETSKSSGTKSKYYMDEDSTDSEAEFHPKLKHVTKKIINRTDKVAQSFKISMKNNKKLLSSDIEIEEILHSKSQMNGKRIKLDTKAAKSSSTKSNDDENKSEDVKEEKNISTLKQLRSRKVGINSKDNKTEKSTDETSKSDNTKSVYYMDEDSTDSEVELQPKPKHVAKKNLNKTDEVAQSSKSGTKNNRKLLSSDTGDEETNKEVKSRDIWAEVYLESEESWICASVMDEKIHCVSEVYKTAKKPVLYVVAWNSEGLIKDVTRRYCSHWLTVLRKRRIKHEWWSQTISYWKEKDTAISRAEDEMFLLKDLEQPLPKTICECKGHPLYVIQKHLRKFEALYPPDCVPLGYLPSGDAIYSRHCVHTCRSRETWLKEAKVVKPNQEPYKIVKGRTKSDKLSGMKIKDPALEIFGEWQTMDYEPPEAKDGIVPRNEFGNVNLFKQRMLPKGTVHLKLPGLGRIARKLDIDCAQAVTGFDFGGMGSVPVFNGFVVCSQYEDILRDAWNSEKGEADKRADEKKEKRVYENWKKLIKGLLIRERLNQKYEFTSKVKSVATNKLKKKRMS